VRVLDNALAGHPYAGRAFLRDRMLGRDQQRDAEVLLADQRAVTRRHS
jgi:hypothetical protein